MKFRILFIITMLFLFNNSYSQEMIDIDDNIYKTAKIGNNLLSRSSYLIVYPDFSAIAN